MLGSLSGTGGTLSLGITSQVSVTSASNSTFAGVITGFSPASFIKAGTGTLTLTGNSSFIGPIVISGGALQIGNGGTSGFLPGNFANNAALVFNRSDAVTYDGVISGTGTVTKLAAGSLTLTGTHTYTGATTVSAGDSGFWRQLPGYRHAGVRQPYQCQRYGQHQRQFHRQRGVRHLYIRTAVHRADNRRRPQRRLRDLERDSRFCDGPTQL
ncbi:MAG: autotransporter-associated beta strand repeat-containing protein [Bradyrhizobium sp.]|nr:autotransporter-associated beta strand repeat-containing protein [Bradyrhizobium sp.]